MVIVLTGGIGSGKSEVCRIVSEKYGIPVYNTDSMVKQLYIRESGLVDGLEKALDCKLRDDSGTFQTRLLADRIFSDKEALKIVEDKVFPYLISDFEQFVRQNPGHVLFESATVLEKPFFDDFGDVIILVDAPVSIRIGRACNRDMVGYNEVKSRVEAQPLMNAVSDGSVVGYPDGSNFAKAFSRVDRVIVNDCPIDVLEEKVRLVFDELLQSTAI